MPALRLGIFLLLAGWLAVSQAHGVRHEISTGPAVSLTLSYANGKPFANEPYALHADGAAKPTLTGHTDSAGRIIFLPGNTQQWRLKAQAAHGHGVNIEFTVPRPPPTPAAPPAPALSPSPSASTSPESQRPNDASLALFGLALLLGGFGAWQLFMRRRG